MKSGFIGIVGRPNVGKSTLINTLIGKKVAITSDKAGTTRNNIQGIYNDEDTQLVFVDTPGIQKPMDKLGGMLNKQAFFSIEDVDLLMFVVDSTQTLGHGDKFIIEKMRNTNKPIFLIINKVDRIAKEDIIKKIIQYKDLCPFAEIIPVSALKKDNTDAIINTLKKYVTDEIKYYEDDQYTNKRTNFLIAELVREKVLMLTKEEVPHAVTVVVEDIAKKKDAFIINAMVVVDRDNLKNIIIGKQGQMIKRIGTMARGDIEKLLESSVFLELRVKTIKNWRDKEHYLRAFGYDEIN